MSAINLQGKSTFGAFVKSALGARTTNGITAGFVSNGTATCSADISNVSSVGIKPSKVGYARSLDAPYGVTQRIPYTDYTFNASVFYAGKQTQAYYDSTSGQSISGCSRHRIGLTYQMPNLASFTTAKLHFNVVLGDNSLESYSWLVAVSASDNSSRYGTAYPWWSDSSLTLSWGTTPRGVEYLTIPASDPTFQYFSNRAMSITIASTSEWYGTGQGSSSLDTSLSSGAYFGPTVVFPSAYVFPRWELIP